MKLHIVAAVVVLDVVVVLDADVVALVEQLQPWLRKIKASSN